MTKEQKKMAAIMKDRGISAREYMIAKASLEAAKKTLLDSITPCTGCNMLDVCAKYGKPESCIKSSFIKEVSRIADTFTIVNPYRQD